MQEALVYSCVFISFSFIAIKRERNEPKKEKNAIITASLRAAESNGSVKKFLSS